MDSGVDLAASSGVTGLLPGELELLHVAEALLATCRARHLMIATAESCTGGLIAATLTAIAGSGDAFAGGFVTYANEMKTALLGVPEAMIAAEGAVSEAVARAMVAGALGRSSADLAVAVTGIAGPTGAIPGKPVGTVWLAAVRRGAACRVERQVFPGSRADVRAAAVGAALKLLEACAGD